MAVKQNNAEGNSSSSVGVNGGATTTSGKVNAVGGATAKKMIPSTDGGGGGGSVGGGGGGNGVGNGVINGSGNNTDQAGCSGANSVGGINVKNKVNAANSSIGVNGNGMTKHIIDLSHILQMIELVEQKQPQISCQELLKIYHHMICELANVQMPRQVAVELKRFKEDINKVGVFFEKANEKRIYLFFLRIVCQLITQTETDPPSCAIAVIFQLFSVDMIFDAVQSLLEHNIPDQNIQRTVRLLCEWLRICNFCQNLNLWIMAILRGLQDQQKYMLFEEIALDNVDQLFASLILPVLRPKVAPIVFHMLASVHQTPMVFHKILPKFPRVIAILKEQSNSMGDYAKETKELLQQLVDLASALMVRFYGYEELYEPVDLALKEFQPSYNYLSCTTNGFKRSEDDNYDAFLQNYSNVKVGLVNLGNTCYMNSVLQALAMTKEFSREILLMESNSPLLKKMQQQIALMHYSSRYELTPVRVLNATRPPGFSPGFQQDSSEFLGYLLETLHEQEVAFQKKQISSMPIDEQLFSKAHKHNDECGVLTDSSMMTTVSSIIAQPGATSITNSGNNCNIIGNVNSVSPNFFNASYSPTTPTKGANSNMFNMIVTPANTNVTKVPTTTTLSTIDKTFTGKLATTYKCLTCGWQSCNIDSFRDLQLSFPEAKNDCSASNYSVQDLIDYYCSPEKLDGDNQYFCERCKRLSDAERYINVINAPKNLILTLKHFKYDQKYHMRAKLMHKVFHDEKVSVKVCSTETLNEIASVHYDLYAGVVHSGFSMDSGHYYTYAADASNKWYKFNDSIVTPSKSEELHNLTPPNTPYILFYQMGARSNETVDATASTKVIKVEVPLPPTLEELPRELRDYVNHDNCVFNEEVKIRRFKQNAVQLKKTGNNGGGGGPRNGYDDDDDDQQPPSSGCGGNAMNINVNRFVY